MLREAIARRYSERGLPTRPDEVMVVNGALSAFALILRLFTGPGDRVVIDAPPIRWPSAPFRAPPAAPSGCASAAGMGLRWTGGDYCADCAAAGVADAGFSQPTGRCMDALTRQRVADIAAGTRTTLVIDETMADLWYNAPPPRRWPASIPMPRCSPLVRPGKASGGTTYRLDPRQRADHRLAYSGPRFAGFGYAAAGATGLQLATGKCRHTAAAAADMLKARRDMCETLMAEYFPRWRFSPPEGGLSFGWNFLTCWPPCSLRVRKAGDPYRHRYAVWAGRGVRSLFTSAVYAAG
nr:Uncharacterized HTH-type transcriptional regulator ydcR [Klebsiella pneumoniae]